MFLRQGYRLGRGEDLTRASLEGLPVAFNPEGNCVVFEKTLSLRAGQSLVLS